MSHCYIAYIPNAGLSEDMLVVKIGHSKSPSSRFEQLCAMGWLMPAWIEATTASDEHRGSEIELFMHERLGKSRIHHEWFHVRDEALDQVKTEVERAFGVAWFLDNVSDKENLDKDTWDQSA